MSAFLMILFMLGVVAGIALLTVFVTALAWLISIIADFTINWLDSIKNRTLLCRKYYKKP